MNSLLDPVDRQDEVLMDYLTFGSAVQTDTLVPIGRLQRTYLSELASRSATVAHRSIL